MNTNSSSHTRPTLTVANLEQKILFLFEMQRQISHGYWSNSKPLNHGNIWSQLTWGDVKIVKIGHNNSIGTENIWPWTKRNYNFSNRQLLETVGPRIRFEIALAKLYENTYLTPDSYVEYITWKEQEIKQESEIIKYVSDSLDTLYSRTRLRKDCDGLKKCFQTIKENNLPMSPAKGF